MSANDVGLVFAFLLGFAVAFACGFMCGDMAAMKRADEHRAELRRIRREGL